MGRGHLENYQRLMNEGYPVKLVALCDVDAKKWKGEFVPGNIDVGAEKFNFGQYSLYSSIDEMLAKEKLDYVDIALPTYLHAENAIKALEAGCHVLCEKPMARTAEECASMIDASRKTGKTLMIAQCLRFWPAYEKLKEIVDNKRFGEVSCAYFYRGGGTPKWSFEDWLMKKELSGGALLDQHIHDVDTINWLFGTPDSVSTTAKNIIPGSGYDVVSTNYHYPDGRVVNAQDDWTINGKLPFNMIFRVSFQTGSVILDKHDGLLVTPDGEKPEELDLPKDTGYYREIRYFCECLQSGQKPGRCTPESTRETIRIAQAEMRSADQGGKTVSLK